MKQPRTREVDVAGAHVTSAAGELGWALVPPYPKSSDSPPRVAFTKSGPLAELIVQLASLIEDAVTADWWLARLSVRERGAGAGSVDADFVGGRRVLTSVATAKSAAERRLAGGRLGRPPSIGPELLDRILEARGAHRTFRAIAAELEAAGVPTPSGAQHWYASTVRAAYERARKPE